MKILNNESLSFFIKLYDSNTNQLCKIKSSSTILFGIKEKTDTFSNKKYTCLKKINNSNFIEGEGFLVLFSPEEINFKKDMYYDIGLQYLDDNNNIQFKFLKESEKLLVENTVTERDIFEIERDIYRGFIDETNYKPSSSTTDYYYKRNYTLPIYLQAGTYTININPNELNNINYFMYSSDNFEDYFGTSSTWKTLPYTFTLNMSCYVVFYFRKSNDSIVNSNSNIIKITK